MILKQVRPPNTLWSDSRLHYNQRFPFHSIFEHPCHRNQNPKEICTLVKTRVLSPYQHFLVAELETLELSGAVGFQLFQPVN
jgi:hypothetical protein